MLRGGFPIEAFECGVPGKAGEAAPGVRAKVLNAEPSSVAASQRLQYPLLQEYILNPIRVPIIIKGLYPN